MAPGWLKKKSKRRPTERWEQVGCRYIDARSPTGPHPVNIVDLNEEMPPDTAMRMTW
jgi:hypothetical protein